MAGVSAVLGAACAFQAPGRLVADTKLDLVLEPGRFLGRALRLWDPSAAFGQVQNQAVGYLFPMGPWFAAGNAAGVPMWLVQRTWTAAVLVAAFWGTVRLADALAVGTPRTRLLAGLAYALAPSMVAVVGSTSGGQLGAALLPWVVLPLVRAGAAGSARRATARSGLAVFAMGGINAVSAVGVLPLPALYLALRRRWSLAAWWALALVLATSWWAIALLLQGRYGLNFLPFTESAEVTTATHSVTQVVRGSGYWLSSLFIGGPYLPAGWDLEHIRLAIIGTGLLAALGLYGLARADMPERTWLLVSAGAATVVLAAGYSGRLGGPLAGPIQDLLDGALAPLRNLDKFQPVLRLPLALGLAHGLTRLPVPRLEPSLATAVAGLCVLAASAPLLRGDLVLDGSFRSVPRYWQDAAQWVDAHDRGARTLLLPAESFASYRWGRTQDEPLSSLLRGRWAVRNLIPLGRPELTHVLDAISDRVERGGRVDGLAPLLARMGVRHVLVRNDVDRVRSTSPPPIFVTRALAGAPGIRRVAAFGPAVDAGLTTDRLVADAAAAAGRVRALEVYEVTNPVARVQSYPADAVTMVAGGPEAALGLADRGLLDPTIPFVLAGDADGDVGIVSDQLRRRDVDFGIVRDNRSYVLAPDEPAPGTDRAPRDWVPDAVERSAVRPEGGTVTASSYASPFARLPEYQPAHAFDGDPATAWVEGAPTGPARQWVEVRVTERISPRAVTVRLLHDHAWRPWVRAVRITTDAGSVVRRLSRTEGPQRVELPRGATRTVRLTILAVEGGSGAGIRDIEVPGVQVVRPLVVPPVTGAPASVLLDRAVADPFDATREDEERVLRRRVGVDTEVDMTVTGLAVADPAKDLAPLLGEAGRVHVRSTSVWEGLPSFAAANVVDGDRATAWLSGADDAQPVLDVSWGEPRVLERLQVRTIAGPARSPRLLRLVTPAGTRDVDVGTDGGGAFEPLTTDRVSVQVVESDPPRRGQGLLSPAGVGIAELSLPALADLAGPPPDRGAEVRLACGQGPPLIIDGAPVATEVEGTIGDVVALRPLTVRACAPVRLAPGEHSVETDTSTAFSVTSLTLTSGRRPDAGPRRPVTVGRWDAERRTVRVGAGQDSLLVTDENVNDGWRATAAGRTLTPVTVDGWRQGWRLPAGPASTVTLEFAPGRTYRLGLVAGAVAVLVLVALALAPARATTATGVLVTESRPVGRDSVTRTRWSRAVVAAGTVLAGGLLAGVFGVVAAVGVLLLRGRWLPWVAGGAYVIAIAVAASDPGRLPVSEAGTYSLAAQALAVVAVTALLASLAPRPDD